MRGLRSMLRRSVRADDDRLLDAAHAAPPSSGPADPLADLLRAAAAPARERELVGEEAAVAAFRAVRRPGATVPVARRRRRFTAGAVVWIAGLAATATAGAALAAVSLDRPPPSAPPSAVPAPTAPAPTTGEGIPTGESSVAPTASPAGSPTGGATAAPASSGPAAPSPGAAADPDPEATVSAGPGNSGKHRGHCRAYLAKSERQRERALRTPAFQDLVVAAGGAEHVEEYCRDLLADSDADPTTTPAG